MPKRKCDQPPKPPPDPAETDPLDAAGRLCPDCGAELHGEGTDFCAECGAEVRQNRRMVGGSPDLCSHLEGQVGRRISQGFRMSASHGDW